MSDFSDRPLVAGVVVGLRAFGVDKMGRLIGPSYNQVFAPGENVAECRKEQGANNGPFAATYAAMMRSYEAQLLYGTSTAPHRWRTSGDKPEKKVEPTLKHDAGVITCTCGFYAYFNGRNDYKQADRVTAIVEGYGVVTMGTEGFRAQKARLAAVVEPGRKFPEHLRSMLHRNYPDATFFASKAEALDAHPLSENFVPSPEDDGFWDRPVVS